MLFIYRKSNGVVLNTPYTNSVFPNGEPDEGKIIEGIVLEHGGTVGDYDFLRIHDEKDAEIVNKTFTHEYTIQNGQVVFGNVKPVPQPEPQPPSEIEKLRIETAQANAEMFEMLLMMTGGSI